MDDLDVEIARRVLGDPAGAASGKPVGARATEEQCAHGRVSCRAMRWRALLWRTTGPRLGSAAPGPMRLFYEITTTSAVRALARDRHVHSVYATGSAAAGHLRPGRSDVDLVAVVADENPEGELAALHRLAGPYRRRQAVFPLDLVTIPAGEFARSAGFHVLRRGRIAEPGPVYALETWRRLSGPDLRGPFRPDPRLFYITEDHVCRALRGEEMSLRADVARQAVPWPEADALRAARTPEQLAAAALRVIDRQRALVEFPSAPAPDGWSALAPSAAAVAAARRLAPPAAVAVTVHHPPIAGAPELLVEGDPEALARWAAERGLAASRAAGLTLRITTPRLAQDAWRGGTRAASLLSSAVHIGGEPLGRGSSSLNPSCLPSRPRPNAIRYWRSCASRSSASAAARRPDDRRPDRRLAAGDGRRAADFAGQKRRGRLGAARPARLARASDGGGGTVACPP